MKTYGARERVQRLGTHALHVLDPSLISDTVCPMPFPWPSTTLAASKH